MRWSGPEASNGRSFLGSRRAFVGPVLAKKELSVEVIRNNADQEKIQRRSEK